ncbi:helix-turn-helix domain-containing protein [Paraburkholderia sp. J10-1]|uniref:helix-turn-helix domain-containing protein n=1 Tax=Paraburkholderia sp. J10-1 TaxID=2805430 RepID=UPI002AB68AF0|nr:helix-turn-helix domain-containing protein [Paraburkholderia sp. J10-1]
MEGKTGFRGPPWTDRRIIAAEMLEAGQSIQQVAAALKLSPATARRYAALFKAGGKHSLLRLRDVGRRRQLTAEGLSWLIAAIKHAPALHGFPTPRWTREAIVELVEQKFGIRYSRSHINRLIRDHGLQEHF